MNSPSGSTAAAPEAAAWSSTGSWNWLPGISQSATATCSPPAAPGQGRLRPEPGESRQVWNSLQRTARGAELRQLGPVKWIPPKGRYPPATRLLRRLAEEAAEQRRGPGHVLFHRAPGPVGIAGQDGPDDARM